MKSPVSLNNTSLELGPELRRSGDGMFRRIKTGGRHTYLWYHLVIITHYIYIYIYRCTAEHYQHRQLDNTHTHTREREAWELSAKTQITAAVKLTFRGGEKIVRGD